MNINNKKLAINGGKQISKKPILIHKPYIDSYDHMSVLKSLKSTFVSGDGPECRIFEKKLSNYLGVKHSLFVNSATSALELAFRVKNFKKGSEVIVPNFTYTSSALGALYNNLKIRLVDVNPENGLICISSIEKLINSKTVAIVAVDYAGIPADMNKINKIARKYNLYVVHDTAQSIGSEYYGKKVGSLADVSTFSFHGTKNLTTGEGGALTTNNDEIANKIKILREKGTDKFSFLTDFKTRGYYEYVDIGMSYIQSNINGAFGITQLSKLDKLNKKRKDIADRYLNELANIPGLNFLNIPKYANHNWHLFGILVPPKYKYWIMDALRAEGVMANVHYTPLHKNKYYKNLAKDKDMKGSIKFFSRLIRLPIYPSLKDIEISKIIISVKKVFSVDEK